MLYRIAGSDAPLFLDKLIEFGLGKPSLRTHRAKFNRLSQGIRQILGLKGKVESLSMILTPSTIEIGVEMTQENFNKSATAGGSPAPVAVGECNCGTQDGHPHEPDCSWWHSHENRVRNVVTWLNINGFNVYGPNLDLKRREMYPNCRNFTASELLEAIPLLQQDAFTRVNLE